MKVVTAFLLVPLSLFRKTVWVARSPDKVAENLRRNGGKSPCRWQTRADLCNPAAAGNSGLPQSAPSRCGESACSSLFNHLQKSRTPPHRGALPFLCCPPRPCEQKSSKKNSHPYTSGVRCGMIPIDSGISGVTTARKAGGGTSAGSGRSARGIRGRNSCNPQCRFAGKFRCS